jgi:hypothetical protein
LQLAVAVAVGQDGGAGVALNRGGRLDGDHLSDVRFIP